MIIDKIYPVKDCDRRMAASKRASVFLFLCLFTGLLSLSFSSPAKSQNRSDPSFIHLPEVLPDEDTPSGLKTTWSCVWFGSYPSSEVVDDDWDLVDSYALQEGDVIPDSSLYEQLSQAKWQGSTIELDGISYYRAAADQGPARDEVREQHYRMADDRPWHYFRISPIRWRVLDIQEGKALLLTDRMPDSMPFHTADEEITWSESTLRSWLNGYGADRNRQGADYSGSGFIDRAFTDAERKAILPVQVKNLPNRDYGTDSGADTEDALFILSNEEVFEGSKAGRYGFESNRDHDDPARRITSTLYAKFTGAWWSPVEAYRGNSFWFMRTSGYTPRSVTYVCDFGFIYSKGTLVTCQDAGILPAMWIDLDLADIKDAGERVSTEIIPAPDETESIFEIPDIKNPVTIQDESQPGKAYTVWNAVAFGHYPQAQAGPELSRKLQSAADQTGGEAVMDGIRYVKQDDEWFRCEPVIWRVLEVTDQTALLMADAGLDCVPYHGEYKDVFWEDCDLRRWLNTDFPEMAFTEEERASLVMSDVENPDNYYFGTACGSGTHDRVFILSEAEVFCSDEAVTYGFRPSDAIPDAGRRIKPSAYAIARGAWISSQPETAGTGFWMLRTNGYTRDNTVYVGEKGYLYNRGIPVTCADAQVVPVIRIRLGKAPLTRTDDISTKLP